MTKNEIMDYVTETPHNINKNILGQKLDEYASQSGGGGFIVNVAYDGASTYLTEATHAEIREAAKTGPVMMIIFDQRREMTEHLSLTQVNNSHAYFSRIMPTGNESLSNIRVIRACMTSANVLTIQEKII